MKEIEINIENLKKLYDPCPQHGWEGATADSHSFYCTAYDEFHKSKCFHHYKKKGITIRKGRTKIYTKIESN
mgnify:CR=1 FL=1